MLVNIDDFHPLKPVRIADQHPIPLGQDGIVLGIPKDDKTFGDAEYCAMLTHDAFLGPSQLATGDLRARFGSVGDALPPHMNTLAAER